MKSLRLSGQGQPVDYGLSPPIPMEDSRPSEHTPTLHAEKEWRPGDLGGGRPC